MVYADLKLLINDAYSEFTSRYVIKKTSGADDEYSLTQLFFVKGIYKVLLNQEDDSNANLLTKEDIQNCIVLFNKYSNSKITTIYTYSI